MNFTDLKTQNYFKLIVVAFVIILIFLIPSISNNLNKSVENVFSSINGKVQPDTNIVLIHITSSDLDNLGDWPLKRSYYALLIKNLKKLKVKKIGLEIFLSNNISTQSIYNEVLNKSIIDVDNLVLASIVEEINIAPEKTLTNKIDFPSPKIDNEKISSGHINFVENSGIVIPGKIYLGDSFENSFSNKLLDIDNNDLTKINFISDWKSFKNYSLLEFFELIEQNDAMLKEFENKIILIGVSDPLIAKTISTGFDKELPGLAIHAFAIDNINNDRNFNYNFINFSKYLFFVMALVLVNLHFRKNKFNFIILLGLLIFSFILWKVFYFELDYTAYLLPILSLIFTNFGLLVLSSEAKIKEKDSISEELKKELSLKEKKLEELRKEFESTKKEDSELLQNKISELENEITNLKKDETEDLEEFSSESVASNFEGIIFKSRKMQYVTDLIKKVAPEEATVLVLGESGTGKELVANAIHNLSKRKDEKFVVVNCAALPDNLLESELFGHVKGAFTDAIKDKIGRFEEAHKGTLFLDEIGETSENFQVKLLRILQTGDFQRVGSSETKHVDVRIVAATNKDLQQLVKEKTFREDLFYRLNVISIDLPSLKERKEDIEILADYFVKQEDQNYSISKAVMQKLIDNDWQGNVRELQAVIKRAVIFTKADNRKIIKLKDLPGDLAKVDRKDLEQRILETLREKEFSHSSISETAKEIGDYNRTVVSEHFRGIFFNNYVKNNFNFDFTIKEIASSNKPEIIERVSSKASKFIKNIEKDLDGIESKSFDEIKSDFSSKYKNLPQKYHDALDSLIKNLIQK